MLLPLRTDAPLRITPYVNWTLIVLNLAMHIAQVAAPAINDYLMLEARNPRLYQFITYQFLHGDAFHLFGNMLFLYIFGNNLNDKMGHWGYLAFYLAGGVFAGVAYIALGATVPVLGASGSVAAVTGAFCVLLPKTQITLLVFFVIIGTFQISSIWFIGAFFLLDVGRQLSPGFFGSDGGVAHSAHIGGSVYGIVVCTLMLWWRLLPRDLFDIVALIERWNRRRIHRDTVSRGYNAFGPNEKLLQQPESQAISPPQSQVHDIRAEIAELLAHGKLPAAADTYLRLLQLDPQQILGKSSQIDIANELYSRGDHSSAAAAYELYLKQYSRIERVEEVQLILGMIYARYLGRNDRARELLTAAEPRLRDEKQAEIARNVLAGLVTRS